jgi:hypothetical protein
MNFGEWLNLSDEERETEKRNWRVFEPGYWHSIAVEAAARFATEFGSTPRVHRVYKSLYRADELVVAVQTNLSPPQEISELPHSYLGFKVMQSAGKLPDGVLVDPGPSSAG